MIVEHLSIHRSKEKTPIWLVITYESFRNHHTLDDDPPFFTKLGCDPQIKAKNTQRRTGYLSFKNWVYTRMYPKKRLQNGSALVIPVQTATSF